MVPNPKSAEQLQIKHAALVSKFIETNDQKIKLTTQNDELKARNKTLILTATSLEDKNKVKMEKFKIEKEKQYDIQNKLLADYEQRYRTLQEQHKKLGQNYK